MDKELLLEKLNSKDIKNSALKDKIQRQIQYYDLKVSYAELNSTTIQKDLENNLNGVKIELEKCQKERDTL